MGSLRSTLPTAVAIAVGLFVLLALFAPYPIFQDIGTYFVDTAVIIAAFALFLGVLNVLRVHARQIRTGPSRLYSFILLIAMLVVLLFGLPPLPDAPSGPNQGTVAWLFENVQVPVQASLSAILVFFVVRAAFRLVSRRSLESLVMLVVMLLVLVGQAALGLLPLLTDVRDWILDVPAMAGVRGILLGVALGALLTGVRLLFGVERPYGD
ncbi:MAG: hypothetical protein JXA93_05675 [Anaerolineae bacterium]|nr:hypothetical protein [Anaerolineae bacterium]